MADTPKAGETVATQPLENKANPTTTTGTSTGGTTTTFTVSDKKTEDSEVEALRKRAEQAEMRANQLANEKKARDEADAKRQAKKLEEKEEFKTLYEQEKTKREEIEREREVEEQRKAVDEASQNVLSDYSDEVKETAKDLGLSLKDVTDEAVIEFKGKLDKIQTRIGSQRVTPNNPGTSSGKKQYTGEELRQILNDPVQRDAYFRKKGGVAAYGMQPEV